MLALVLSVLTRDQSTPPVILFLLRTVSNRGTSSLRFGKGAARSEMLFRWGFKVWGLVLLGLRWNTHSRGRINSGRRAV